MSAGKLSRVAGSVFVLAAIVGGIGLTDVSAQAATVVPAVVDRPGTVSHVAPADVDYTIFDYMWG